jgi:hypothetical protein
MRYDKFINEMRALMSKKRRHRERDLYDLYFFIGKNTAINKELINKKLLEAKISPSLGAFERAIKEVSKTWDSLEPMVQHKLEGFSYVSDFVAKKIKESGVF